MIHINGEAKSIQSPSSRSSASDHGGTGFEATHHHHSLIVMNIGYMDYHNDELIIDTHEVDDGFSVQLVSCHYVLILIVNWRGRKKGEKKVKKRWKDPCHVLNSLFSFLSWFMHAVSRPRKSVVDRWGICNLCSNISTYYSNISSQHFLHPFISVFHHLDRGNHLTPSSKSTKEHHLMDHVLIPGEQPRFIRND